MPEQTSFFEQLPTIYQRVDDAIFLCNGDPVTPERVVQQLSFYLKITGSIVLGDIDHAKTASDVVVLCEKRRSDWYILTPKGLEVGYKQYLQFWGIVLLLAGFHTKSTRFQIDLDDDGYYLPVGSPFTGSVLSCAVSRFVLHPNRFAELAKKGLTNKQIEKVCYAQGWLVESRREDYDADNPSPSFWGELKDHTQKSVMAFFCLCLGLLVIYLYLFAK